MFYLIDFVPAQDDKKKLKLSLMKNIFEQKGTSDEVEQTLSTKKRVKMNVQGVKDG